MRHRAASPLRHLRRDRTVPNRKAQELELLAEHEEQLDAARAGGGPRYPQRHHDRGRLLARERIELLLDRDSPFLELSTARRVGHRVHRRREHRHRHRRGLRRRVRAHRPRPDRARRRDEPVHAEEEPAGAGDRAGQPAAGDQPRRVRRRRPADPVRPVRAGRQDLPRPHRAVRAWAIPTIALVFGNSTAGGAYVPGMCDYAVLVDQQAKVFLGGPPLVKMATGEDADDEELGGARDARPRLRAWPTTSPPTSATPSGSAARSSRELNWRKLGPGPSLPADEPRLRPRRAARHRVRPTSGCRSTRARCSPASSTAPSSTSTSRCTAPAWSPAGPRSTAIPVGVLANARGVLFSEEAKKASRVHPARQPDRHARCCSCRTPPATWSARSYEQGGIIKDGAKMINAVTNSTVPHLTVIMAASFGAGNYGMCGRAYDPRFLFAWADAKIAVMGAAQLAGVLSIVGEASPPRRRAGRSTRRPTTRRRRGDRGADRARSRTPSSSPRGSTTTACIDPRDTRTVLGIALSAVHSEPRRGTPRLRRLPDVTRRVTPHPEAARRQPRRDRRPASSAPRARWTSPPSRCSPTPTPTRRSSPLADEAVRLPGAAPADTYLRGDLIVAAAAGHRRRRVHPGYGFLSENAGLRPAPAPTPGCVFVGPAAGGDRGDGLEDRRQGADGRGRRPRPARAPWSTRDDAAGPGRADAAAAEGIGYPGAGQGGLRRRRPRHADRPRRRRARRRRGRRRGARRRRRSATARCSSSGSSTDPRHVEVQIFGDTHGTVVHLFERECSIQRRYQKIVEEAPSPAVDAALRDRARRGRGRRRRRRSATSAPAPSSSCSTRTGEFFFLEVNTRLQVEHPVTELVTGLDLVAAAAAVADGRAAARRGHRARRITGHAIEARLYAEDVAAGFLPGHRHRCTASRSRRCPASASTPAYADGSVVSTHYDAMLAKVIAHGATRDAGRRRLARALAEARLHGVTTNRDLLVGVLRDAEFRRRPHRHRLPRPARPGRAVGRHRRREPALRVHALAAALAGAGRAPRRPRPVQRPVPSGWRNVAQRRPDRDVPARRRRTVEVAYRFGRRRRLRGASVDGEAAGRRCRCTSRRPR